MTPYVLLAIGLILIFIEFYVPGAIMGIAGGVFVFASFIAFAMQSDSWLAIVAYGIGVTVLLVVLVRFALWRIQSAKPDLSILSKGSQVGYQASGFDKSVIGKIGVVVTDLKPGGHILIEGKRLQAISESGYIVRGSEVEVVAGQEDSLIVKSVKKDVK